MLRFVIIIWVGFIAGLAAAGTFLAITEPYGSALTDAMVAVGVFAAAFFAGTLVARSVNAWVMQPRGQSAAVHPASGSTVGVH